MIGQCLPRSASIAFFASGQNSAAAVVTNWLGETSRRCVDSPIVDLKEQTIVCVSEFVVRKGSPTVFDGQNGLVLMPGKAGNPAGGAVHSVGVAIQNPS